MMNRFLLLAALISVSLLSTASANDNVRAVQTKLKDGGFYFGEIDGAFSSDLSAAMTRFQIRNGLQVSGQLDEETSKALGVTAAVTTTTPEAATTSETWRRLRKSDQEFLAKQPAAQTQAPRPAATPAVKATAAPDAEQADPQPSFTAQNRGPAIQPGQSSESVSMSLNTERLRDYVGAFVLAGLDPQVGAELEFFADEVRYYWRRRDRSREDPPQPAEL
jgi:peptidoglycan hydrolase-like protein with peptidoglycan-binding domain